ncbi:cytochrome C [Blautia massiliensis (ex Durand et al. 2017)]|uniref:cytochrome C n=1 Tax=Lachnospiraceae TaxID=186803 RepID=UPI00242A7DC4|nr:cytochrome C [Blautia massiliensis (ex Durand et al. 2017)]MDD6547376.1 cytochrome C [Blautia massiliensis (ex Durand et al. 2017)]
MHSISNKQYEEYQQYLYDKDHSRIITPDFIRFLCQANNFEPEAIGKQILEYYGKYRAEGYYDLRK